MQMYSELYVSESGSGNLCFSLPARYYCCLPILSVMIYSYTWETWMFLIRIHWTASVNIDFPLWKITFLGI